MSIFSDGFILKEFLNPNYRGVVGWPCVYIPVCGDAAAATCLTTCQSEVVFLNARRELSKTTDLFIQFEQFTPSDIPVGELCWFEDTYYDEIQLAQFFPELTGNSSLVVPYLIAETAERAEELKDWWK